MRSRVLAVVVMTVLVSLCAGVASAFAQATPTLGELARKEQERRKALKAAGKTLSNGDLPKATPKPPAEGGTATTAKPEAEDEKAKAEDKDKKDDRDETWWRQRMNGLRGELLRNEMFLEALQTRINSLTADFAARDDPYQKARIAEDRQKAMAELDRVKSDIELQKKKISDAEEEARVQGVPPGWLR